MREPTLHCECEGAHCAKKIEYTGRPEGETDFGLDEGYHRIYMGCTLCGHFYSSHSYDLEAIYTGRYSECTYGDRRKETFVRIMNLPEEKSDNQGRCQNIQEFCLGYWNGRADKKLLDVGSGLGVFPALMQESGWQCTALDPDLDAIKHIKEVVGCDCICGDFRELRVSDDSKYSLITFNKVLEHLIDPVVFLEASKDMLRDNGLVYIEVPDGEAAYVDGKHREEFFIEHHYVFSVSSVSIMLKAAGF